MPTRKSILMMSSTGREWTVVGKAIRADSFFGGTSGLHTVQVSFNNFTGAFKLQGTLALEPTDTDWFDIDLATGQCCHGKMVTYPKDPANPTTRNHMGDSGTDAFTFVGNMVWLRAIMTRDYLDPEPNPEREDLGQIQKVLLAF